ncbi:hypothetical protein PZ897_16010 [Hoeflea sp. YIM 152468]|uniref:hypothetical protein n=1 Tax=Hoeflea sp. YIM 152468 TaxID=3031759 RepID=UPI0023DAEA30|nr:hypothetical protein [Hoeflea sp. YIM 152468]MDF1609692.1 hypothetical protein [Hoeflea sp. YIM 152468]
MHAKGCSNRGHTILASVCAAVLIVLTGAFLLNRMSLEVTQSRLQARADSLALATLLSHETDDALALEYAGQSTGISPDQFSGSLRRYRNGEARASEVLLSTRHAPPLILPGSRHPVNVEATGKAITWR